MLAALCCDVPANHVLDEETQEKFFAVFNVMDLKIVKAARSKMHRNPASPEGYFSSSYIADRNGFDAPLGGYGPPVSINGGFYHSHETQSFKDMHDKVDQSAYGLPSPPRASERCTTSGRTNANAHRCPPYTTKERPSSPPTSPRSPCVIPTITVVDVDAVEQDLYKNNASTATFDQPAHLEADEDAILELITSGSIDPSDASPINAGATEGSSSVEGDIVNKDDSGIATDYTPSADLEERKDGASTKDNGVSFSQDSAYATQPFKDLDDDDNELDELAQDTRPSARLGAQFGSPDIDTTNVATNSSNPDNASAPTSSLGKRKADSNYDSDDENFDNDITDTATTSSNPDPASVPASSLGKRKAESDSNNESENNNGSDKDNDNESEGQKHKAKRAKLTES